MREITTLAPIGDQVTEKTDIAVEVANDPLRLAELLAIRLCHDLSGPLGTMMGALEMVADDPEMADEALPLAGEASSRSVGDCAAAGSPGRRHAPH